MGGLLSSYFLTRENEQNLVKPRHFDIEGGESRIQQLEEILIADYHVLNKKVKTQIMSHR
jgi:hypothetical protein